MSFHLQMHEIFCPNENCDDHKRKGLGNIIIQKRYGKDKRRLLRCKTCKSIFSERKITFFYGMHTAENKIKEVITYLLHGMSYREAATVAQIDKDTVQRIWRRFLDSCEDSMKVILHQFNINLEDFVALLHRKSYKGNR